MRAWLLWVFAAGCTFRPGSWSVSGDAGSDSDDAPVEVESDATTDATSLPAASCAEIHATDPSAPTGVYMIDPDGSGAGAPFPVACDMSTQGGGWTLVGKELPFSDVGQAGPLRYLGIDSMNPDELAAGTQSGIIGRRFAGAYQDVLIVWGTSYIRFTRPPAFDMFSNTVNLSANVTSFATNDADLTSWTAGPGAKLCVAARATDIRPGDTSWAIKPANDNNTACGCSSTNWAGRGAYYCGTPSGQQPTSCAGWGGGWAGPKDDGEVKSNIAPTVPTSIFIR